MLSICIDVSLGMKYVHSKSIIHGDLHLKNILFDHFFNAKISDFGLSKSEVDIGTKFNPSSMFYLRPPEDKASKVGDVYMFSLLLLQLLSQIRIEDIKQIHQLLDINFSKQTLHDIILSSLCKHCFHTDPNQRPLFDIISQWLILSMKSLIDSILSDSSYYPIVSHPIFIICSILFLYRHCGLNETEIRQYFAEYNLIKEYEAVTPPIDLQLSFSFYLYFLIRRSFFINSFISSF